MRNNRYRSSVALHACIGILSLLLIFESVIVTGADHGAGALRRNTHTNQAHRRHLQRSTPCTTNGDCSLEEFCTFKGESREETCNGNINTGRCRTRPIKCSKEFDPVCGCDGKTYPTSCVAESMGIVVADPNGACACSKDEDCASESTQQASSSSILASTFCRFETVGECSGSAICVEKPFFCPLIIRPVCGCDGVTYPNDCSAYAAGASIADLSGPCSDDCSTDDDCVAPLTYCKFNAEGSCSGDGTCTDFPINGCPEIEEPVCGCDGQSYANACEASAVGVSIQDPNGPCTTSSSATELEEGEEQQAESMWVLDIVCVLFSFWC